MVKLIKYCDSIINVMIKHKYSLFLYFRVLLDNLFFFNSDF